MRFVRLSYTDAELFDTAVDYTEYLFYLKHKDVFRRMWIEQVKHGSYSKLSLALKYHF